MNNNTFSTSTTISVDDYMLFPYNDHYPSQPVIPFSPSSSIDDILIHSTSNTSNNHLDHHHQFLPPSPFPQFDFVPDCALLDSFLPQNNGHDDNQTVTSDNHHPSLLPPLMNNTIGDQPIEPSETITHIEDSQTISTSQDPKMKKAKKPSRTDRHSKIKTANGTRDRRMRLSLDVAKELFGLQDMLGFDKASKTVEWLLTQAKPEIRKIAKSHSHRCGFSSGDESHNRSALGSMDTSSSLCELTPMWTVDDRGNNTNSTGNKVNGRSMKGKRKRPEPRTPILKKLSKDERAKARERAKDRTMEKRMMKMKGRSQSVNIVEEEVHHQGEIVKNNLSEGNQSSFKVTQCVEDIEELCKNDRFAVCNDFVMNKKDHISNESYDIINRKNSSFPMISHHRSQGAANSIEQQQQFTDLHHRFWAKPRDLMYNY
ncbi:PREDICTED: transcription factor TCP18 isoform X2 [Camelina sativa]|uniref:Transcription factor TCP18 isoform X2 n=1 Tax=Camelina sativa TaxID=90675 RepID=A0ABM1R0G4_CAMSA|nr:PREDICTED: transcription factor TCP18 isoform X2 [Camelina sativa]